LHRVDIRYRYPLDRREERLLEDVQLRCAGPLASGSVRVLKKGGACHRFEAVNSIADIRRQDFSRYNSCPIHRWYGNKKRDRGGRKVRPDAVAWFAAA